MEKARNTKGKACFYHKFGLGKKMKKFLIIFSAVFFSIDFLMRCFSDEPLQIWSFLLLMVALYFWSFYFFPQKIERLFCHTFGKFFKNAISILSICVISLMLFLWLTSYSDTSASKAKAVIVLGAAIYEDTISEVLTERLDTAYTYAQKYPEIPIIVSGGTLRNQTRSEAQAMQDYLVKKGISPNRIWKEEKSTSTQENFRFSKQLLEEKGINTSEIVYITNRFHIYRAKQFAQAEGFLNMKSVPAPTPLRYVLPSYLREVFAVLYFWTSQLFKGISIMLYVT